MQTLKEYLRRWAGEWLGGILWGAFVLHDLPLLGKAYIWLLQHPIEWALVFYWLYLVYAAYKGAKDRGVEIPLVAKALIVPAVAFGYVLDVSWNTFVASFHYWEVPWRLNWKLWTWTFTDRIDRHKHDSGWRGWQSRRIWAPILNPFEIGGHIKGL